MNLKYVNYFQKPTTRVNFQFWKFHLIPKIEIKVNVLFLKIELNTKWKNTIGRKFSKMGDEGEGGAKNFKKMGDVIYGQFLWSKTSEKFSQISLAL